MIKKPWQMTQDEFLMYAYPLSVRRQRPPAFSREGYRLYIQLGESCIPTEEDVRKAEVAAETFVRYRRKWRANPANWERKCGVDFAPDIDYACRLSGLFVPTVEAHFRMHHLLCRQHVALGGILPLDVAVLYPNLAKAQVGEVPLPAPVKFAPKRLTLLVLNARCCRRKDAYA